MTPTRTRPLSAAGAPPATSDPDDLDDEASAQLDERHTRFTEGVRSLKVGGASALLSERLLLVLAGIVAPLGLVVVILGWWGASRTPYGFEQTPYLISGLGLGLGLVFLGSFFYFAHWLTQLVKEHRAQTSALLAALERLGEQVEGTSERRPRRAG